MTCAHHCLLTQLCTLLRELPDIRLRMDDTAGELGFVDFVRREIVIDRGATLPEFRSTLAHELAHLVRGPAVDDPEAIESDEREVAELAARFLVPRSHLPDVLEAADPVRVAAELSIDVATARLGIALAIRDRDESLHETDVA